MREVFGGLEACGVFASILSSFVLFLVLFCPLSCPLFCPLSCPFALVFAFLFVLFAPAFISFPAFLACPLVLSLSSWLLGFCSWSCPFSLCGSLLFLFPFRYIRKKKGRSVLVRPLLSCCGCVGCYPITTIFPASTLYSIPATL